MSSYNALLQALLGGQYQGVGGTTTGPGEYYYNPTSQTQTLANYFPENLNTLGQVSPWAQYGFPDWYGPGSSYMQTDQGAVPNWASTQNWMPESWQGQVPAPTFSWQDQLNALFQQPLQGLAPTTGMPQSQYQPSNYMQGYQAPQDFTTPNLTGQQTPAPAASGWSNVGSQTNIDPNDPRFYESYGVPASGLSGAPYDPWNPYGGGYAPSGVGGVPPGPGSPDWDVWQWIQGIPPGAWNPGNTWWNAPPEQYPNPADTTGGGGGGPTTPTTPTGDQQSPEAIIAGILRTLIGNTQFGGSRDYGPVPSTSTNTPSTERPPYYDPTNPPPGEWDPETGTYTIRTGDVWGRAFPGGYPSGQTGTSTPQTPTTPTSTNAQDRPVMEPWVGGVTVWDQLASIFNRAPVSQPGTPIIPGGQTPPTTGLPPQRPAPTDTRTTPGGTSNPPGSTPSVPNIPIGGGGGINVPNISGMDDRIWPYLSAMLGLGERNTGMDIYGPQRNWALGQMTDLPAQFQSSAVQGPSYQDLMNQPGMNAMTGFLGGGGIPNFLGQYQGGIEGAIANMLGGQYMQNPAQQAVMSNYRDLLTGAIQPHGQQNILDASGQALSASQGLIPQLTGALGGYLGGDFSKMALSPEVQALASSLMATGLPAGYEEAFKKRIYDPQRDKLLGDLAQRGVLDSGDRLKNERELFQREYMDSLMLQQQEAQRAGAQMAMANLLGGGQLGLQGIGTALGAQGQFANQGMGGYNQVNQLLNQILSQGGQFGLGTGQLGLQGQQAGVGATTSALTQPYLSTLGLGLQQAGQGAQMGQSTSQQALNALLGSAGVLSDVFRQAEGTRQFDIGSFLGALGQGTDWQKSLQGYDLGLKGLGLEQAKLEELKKSGTLQLLSSIFQGAPAWMEALKKIFG